MSTSGVDAFDQDDVEYEARAGRFRAHHDWERGDSISVSVVEGVGVVTEQALTDIEPLYEVIDPDALDRFIASLRADGRGTARFALSGCEVTVSASGVIEIQPAE